MKDVRVGLTSASDASLPLYVRSAVSPPDQITRDVRRTGWRERCSCETCCRPNGPEVNPRGQGPRGYGSAARRLPAFEARDAGGVTPRKLR